jgi:hypothetical protein
MGHGWRRGSPLHGETRLGKARACGVSRGTPRPGPSPRDSCCGLWATEGHHGATALGLFGWIPPRSGARRSRAKVGSGRRTRGTCHAKQRSAGGRRRRAVAVSEPGRLACPTVPPPRIPWIGCRLVPRLDTPGRWSAREGTPVACFTWNTAMRAVAETWLARHVGGLVWCPAQLRLSARLVQRGVRGMGTSPTSAEERGLPPGTPLRERESARMRPR